MMVADTDVLIDSLKGIEPVRSRIALEVSTGNLATTAVTSYELLSGARTQAQRSRIQRLLAALTVLPLDSSAAEAASRVRRDLEAKGEGIGMADYLIAGICLVRNGLLLTRNRRHFQRVDGLQLGHFEPGQWN